jgi:hypothetical protein
LKGTHPENIPATFVVIWFSGFRREDLNVIFYKNMPNLHNRYISAERKISQKNPEYMLNYFLPSFSRDIPIMQIRHIFIKDHISIFSSETAEPN